MRSSPSSASFASTPGCGLPTVPILIRSGGLDTVRAVSVIPQISATGRPRAVNRWCVSSRIGAAAAPRDSVASNPALLRNRRQPLPRVLGGGDQLRVHGAGLRLADRAQADLQCLPKLVVAGS